MGCTFQRRLDLIDFISVKRRTTIKEITDEFHISKSTAQRDLDAITPYACFYTISGRGGGIIAEEGWYSSQRNLSPVQKQMLTEMITTVAPDKQPILLSILLPNQKSDKSFVKGGEQNEAF